VCRPLDEVSRCRSTTQEVSDLGCVSTYLRSQQSTADAVGWRSPRWRSTERDLPADCPGLPEDRLCWAVLSGDPVADWILIGVMLASSTHW